MALSRAEINKRSNEKRGIKNKLINNLFDISSLHKI